jgi:hypothetical protein
MQRLSVFVVTLGTVSFAQVACADCGALFDALEKADKQERFAMYLVEKRDQPLPAKPITVRIGKVVYDGSVAGPTFVAHQTDGINPIMKALRKAKQEGQVKCEQAGSDSYRGQAAERFKFDNPLMPARYNPTTLWVAKSSGMPVYHEVNDFGGFVWLYGSAVRDPVVSK